MSQHTLFGRFQRIDLIAALVFPVLTACGGGSGSSVDMPARPISVSLFAGYPLGEGNQDGPTSTTASFSNSVQGMALTSSGDVIIADTNNNLIRKLSADYQTVTTLAGSRVPLSATSDAPTSYLDGTGSDARFDHPAAVAVDAAGNTYVADSGNHLVRKISPAGVVTTLAGQAGVCGSQDGVGSAASLCNPIGITSSKTGIVYVLERFPDTGKRQVRKITPEGRVSKLDLNLQDIWVTALATDSAGTLFFAEFSGISLSNRLLRYDANDQVTVVADMSSFGAISNLAFDAFDRPFVIAEVMGAIFGSASHISLVRIGDNGRGTTVFRQFCEFGRFGPFGSTPLAAKADGQILVALRGCTNENPYPQLRSYTQQGTYKVVAGPVSPIGTRDGQGDVARFGQPSALAFDPSGTLYVRDYSDTSRSSIMRNVQADGLVRTLGRPGSACTSFTGLVYGAVQNQGPMAADGAGNLYQTDGRRILKMKDCKVELLLDLDAFLLSNSVDGGVTGLATDTSGNIYVSTSGGVILKLDADRQPTLFAGSAAQYGHRDGQGLAARFAELGNMTIDAAGNLYVIDGPPPSSLPAWKDIPTLGPVIRKVTPDGLVSTLAGNPNEAPGHADGIGPDARFSIHYYQLSASIAVDNQGNLYVSDPENSVIRKVTPDGRVSTPVGQVGHRGFSTAEVPGSIGRPAGIAIRDSKLYIAVPHALLQAKLSD